MSSNEIDLNISAEELQMAIDNLDYFSYDDLTELKKDVDELIKHKNDIRKLDFSSQGMIGAEIVTLLEKLNKKIIPEIEERTKEDTEASREEKPLLLEYFNIILLGIEEYKPLVNNGTRASVLAQKGQEILDKIADFTTLYDLSDSPSIKNDGKFKKMRKAVEKFRKKFEYSVNMNEFIGDMSNPDGNALRAKLYIQANEVVKKGNSLKLEKFNVNDLGITPDQKALDSFIVDAGKLMNVWKYVENACGGVYENTELQLLLYKAEKYWKKAKEINKILVAQSKINAGDIKANAPHLVLPELNRENFKLEFKQEIKIWANRSSTAILGTYNAVKDVAEEKEDKLFTLDMVLDLVGLLENDGMSFSMGPYVAFAKVAMQFTKNVIEANMPKNKVTFRDLCEKSAKGFEKLHTSDLTEMFEAFIEAFKKENKEYTSEDFFKTIGNLSKELDNSAKIKQGLMIEWVNASTDSLDSDDWAGVIEVYYSSGGGTWYLAGDTKIDDTEDQKGTIRGMKEAFGKGTLLYNIPLPMKIFLNQNCCIDRKKAVAGDTNFKYISGDKSLYNSFMRDKPWEKTGKISDLNED